MTTYYVDATNGNDNNVGTSPDTAWETVSKVNNESFAPGDSILFKRGNAWTGTKLVISDDGKAGQPITVGAYGSGDKPSIQNSGSSSNETDGIQMTGRHVTVENVMVEDVHNWGVHMDADYGIVQNCEITNVGIGVGVSGQNCLITGNYIHDLNMVVNDAEPTHNDYGAVGVWFYNSFNEASYNTLINCEAVSQDYGYDGGAFEFWVEEADGTIRDVYIHHNYAELCNGFCEISTNEYGNAIDIRLSYNVIIDCGYFTEVSIGPPYGSDVRNFRVDHNSYWNTKQHDNEWAPVIAFWDGDPGPQDTILYNNAFYVDGMYGIAERVGFTHDYNIFYLAGDTILWNLTLNEHESTQDPLYNDPENGDLHLRRGSPCIGAAKPQEYTADYDDNPVPAGENADIGAFEAQRDYRFQLPSADALAGAWSRVDGAADLYAALDDDVPDTEDAVRSEDRPSASPCVVKLGSAPPPDGEGGHYLRYTYRRAGAHPLAELTVELRQGYTDEGSPGTLIASWLHSKVPATWKTVRQELTTEQAENIDWGGEDLYVRMVANLG